MDPKMLAVMERAAHAVSFGTVNDATRVGVDVATDATIVATLTGGFAFATTTRDTTDAICDATEDR